MLLDETIERQSICELELDCVSENILNPNLDKGKNYMKIQKIKRYSIKTSEFIRFGNAQSWFKCLMGRGETT